MKHSFEENLFEEKNRYLDLIHQAEKLRVEAAVGGEYDDQKYSQALELLRPETQKIPADEIPNDNDLTVVWTHLFLLASAIQQSRALHTISEAEEKQLALKEAKRWLEQAKPLVEVLDKNHYYWAVDRTPWIWKTEWFRGMARVYQRWPSQTQEEKDINQRKTVQYYQQALEVAQRVKENKDLDNEIRASALMAVGTVRVELALAKDALQKINPDLLRKELAKAFNEASDAWNQGYENLDRFITTSGRIIRKLRKMNDKQSQSLLKQITQLAIQVLESKKEDPLAQKWLQKAKELLPNHN